MTSIYFQFSNFFFSTLNLLVLICLHYIFISEQLIKTCAVFLTICDDLGIGQPTSQQELDRVLQSDLFVLLTHALERLFLVQEMEKLSKGAQGLKVERFHHISALKVFVRVFDVLQDDLDFISTVNGMWLNGLSVLGSG